MNKLIIEAKKFAIYHHRAINQRRKYTNEPYEVHPAAVAKLVQSIGGTDSMVAAAWLHDTVEDTAATAEMINENFGPVIADYVEQLTDVAQYSDGNRAARLKINIAHTAKACAAVKSIKLADIIDNLKSISKYDPKFSILYHAEKEMVLPYLKEGNAELFMRLQNILSK